MWWCVLIHPITIQLGFVLRYFLLLFFFATSVVATETAGTHYEDQGKGFYWYDPYLEEVDEPKEKPPEPKAEESKPTKESKSAEKVVLNSEWLRENLPKLQEKAMDHPTDENLAMYYYAQRLSLDVASRFAKRTKEYFITEPALDENLRRPTIATSLLTRKAEVRDNKEKLLQGITDKVGLFFFYRSDCPYCHKQSHSIWLLQERLGLEVLGVSMDGRVLQSPKSHLFPHKMDRGLVLSKKYKIAQTPTTVLVDLETGQAVPIGYGVTDYQTIIGNSLIVSNQLGHLTDDEMNTARSVKDISSLSDEESGITVDKKALDENPSIIVDMLRERLMVGSKLNNPDPGEK